MRHQEVGQPLCCGACGKPVMWWPVERKGPAFCCEGCATGQGCDCRPGPPLRATPAAGGG
jgi:hypothetical protein